MIEPTIFSAHLLDWLWVQLIILNFIIFYLLRPQKNYDDPKITKTLKEYVGLDDFLASPALFLEMLPNLVNSQKISSYRTRNEKNNA